MCHKDLTFLDFKVDFLLNNMKVFGSTCILAMNCVNNINSTLKHILWSCQESSAVREGESDWVILAHDLSSNISSCQQFLSVSFYIVSFITSLPESQSHSASELIKLYQSIKKYKSNEWIIGLKWAEQYGFCDAVGASGVNITLYSKMFNLKKAFKTNFSKIFHLTNKIRINLPRRWSCCSEWL